MASVWLARLRGKRDFEKLYAIKTIKTELGEDTRFQEMFLDEARLASGIEHPNVAHILDLGEQDGILYIVMEFVDGESLAKVARQARRLATPLTIGLSLRIMADACAGLHAAHELKDRSGETLGVIHRDVSPQNILVATNGAVKVIDFGVAKARNRRASETGEGVVKGKIRFMAPEQVRAQPLDRRADIWAVGVCLHELATGRLPFDDESDVDVVRRLISDEPPPPFDDVPGPVAEILRHSLVRDPNERFSTAAAMRRAIELAMTEMHVQSTSEDVADFVRANLPEFAEKRHAVISKAMADADKRTTERASAGQLPAADVKPEDAFAPTIVSQRAPNASPSATPALKPRPSARDVLEGRVSADESVAGAFTEEEKAVLPKRRNGWWLIVVAAMAAGAYFAWPRGGHLKLFGAQAPLPTAPIASDTAAPSASAAQSASASPSASSAVSAAREVDAAPLASASASSSAAPVASATTTSTARPHSTDVGFTTAPPTATATATTTATVTVTAPTATATEPAPTATHTNPPPEDQNPY